METIKYKIEKGRDKGKTFVISEMPVLEVDNWAFRLYHEACKAGVDLKGEEMLGLNTSSMVGIIEIGLLIGKLVGKIEPEKYFELRNEVLEKCVKILPSGGNERDVLWGSEISDPTTFSKVFFKWVEMYKDFLFQGDQ